MPYSFSFDYSVLSCLSFPCIWSQKLFSPFVSLLFLKRALSLAALPTNTISATIAIVIACRSNFSTAELTPVQTKKSCPVIPASPGGCLAVRSSSLCIKQSSWTFPSKLCLLFSSVSVLSHCGKHYHPTCQSCSYLGIIFSLVVSFSPCLHIQATAKCWRVILHNTSNISKIQPCPSTHAE